MITPSNDPCDDRTDDASIVDRVEKLAKTRQDLRDKDASCFADMRTDQPELGIEARLNGPPSDEEEWFHPGDRLGEYDIIRVIDKGTFSYNLEVKDKVRRSFHAIVHLREDTSGESLEGLQLETSLSHPALPTIPFVGGPCRESHGRVWFVRQLLPPPLSAEVEKTGVCRPTEQVVRIGQRICSLLEYLHDSSRHPESTAQVHGFLVPGYIHVTEVKDAEEVKVAGMDVQVLVRAGQEIPKRHQSYRCPECLESPVDELTAANDLWALAGCLLYLASGRGPVDVGTIEAMRAAHAAGIPQQRAGELTHPTLKEVLLKAFSPDLADRFQNAQQMRLALSADGSGEEDSPQVRHAIENKFPYPIARSFYQLRGTDDWIAQIQIMANVLTVTLEHLTIVALAEYLSGSIRSADLNARLEDTFKKPVTHGKWAESLREALKVLGNQPVGRFTQELFDCYFPAKGERALVTLQAQVDELVTLRNELLKGSADSLPDRETQRRFKRKLIAFLRAVAFLKDYPLVSVRLTQMEERIKTHTCLLHLGFHDTFENVAVQCDLDLEKTRVAMLSPRAGELIYLYPFYVVRECPKCGVIHFFRFDKIDGKAIEFVSTNGHRLMDAGAWTDLAQLLRRPNDLLLRHKAHHLSVEIPDSRSTLSSGHLVNGKYEIIEHLRRGGMADVYKVRTIANDTVLALKLLPFQFMSDRKMLARFKQEVRESKALDHPNITRVLDDGEGLHDHYLVMELAPGWGPDSPALDVSELHTPLQIPDALHIVRQACEGLDYIHQKGIIHRDIKPRNILLFDQRQVKLADFGIARSRESVTLTLTGLAMGTPEYMSPEQADGKRELSPSSDIYSLGVVLYELLTGISPFKRRTPFATALAHLRDAVPSPRGSNRDISPELEKILLRCLAKEPEERIPSARALLEALASCDSHAPDSKLGSNDVLVEEKKLGELANAAALFKKGNALQDGGRLTEAIAEYDAAIAILRRLVEEDKRGELASDLALVRTNKGNALRSLGKLEEALAEYDTTIAILRSLVEQEGRHEFANNLAGARMNKGRILHSLGRLDETVAEFDLAIVILRRLVEEGGRGELANDLAAAKMNKGVALDRLGRSEEAIAEFDASIAILRRLVEEDRRGDVGDDLAMTQLNKGVVLNSLGRPEEAIAEYDASIAILRRLVEEENRGEFANKLALVRLNKGTALRSLGRPEKSDAAIGQSPQSRPFATLHERLHQEWKPRLAGKCEGLLPLEETIDLLFQAIVESMKPEWISILETYATDSSLPDRLTKGEEQELRQLRNLGLIRHDGRWLFTPPRSKHVFPTSTGNLFLALSGRTVSMDCESLTRDILRPLTEVIDDPAAVRVLNMVRQGQEIAQAEMTIARRLRNMHLISHESQFLSSAESLTITDLGCYLLGKCMLE